MIPTVEWCREHHRHERIPACDPEPDGSDHPVDQEWEVRWENNAIYCPTPEGAAREALEMIASHRSIAHVFSVRPTGDPDAEFVTVDLDNLDGRYSE